MYITEHTDVKCFEVFHNAFGTVHIYCSKAVSNIEGDCSPEWQIDFLFLCEEERSLNMAISDYDQDIVMAIAHEINDNDFDGDPYNHILNALPL